MRRTGQTARILVSMLLAAGLLAMLGADRAAALDPFTFGKPRFCTPKKPLRDFGISRLPRLRELPVHGTPPFAPKSVSVYGGFTRILTKRGSFGYGFSERNFGGKVRLDWTVTAQMWKLSRSGRPLREVDRVQIFIGRLDASDQPHISAETLGKRGFYRFDIQFADRDGKRLGSYSAYLKVVRPYWKARLGLDRRSYRPGQLLLSRVENYGTEWASFGEAFAVQRREAGEWTAAPDLTPRGWLLWAGHVGPGGAGRCSPLRLPRDVAPGGYRIVKQVTQGADIRGDRTRWLTASFRVR